MAVKWDGPYGIHKNERKPEGIFTPLGIATGTRVLLVSFAYIKSPQDLLNMANEFCEFSGLNPS